MSEESYSMEPEPTLEPAPPSGAKTGMILGIIGTVVGVLGVCVGIGCAGLGYVFAIAAVALGVIALTKGKEDLNPQTARILGIIAIVAGVLTLLVSCANSIIGAFVLQGNEIQRIFEDIQRELQP